MRVRRVSTSRRSETIVLRLRASTPAAASSRFSRPTSARSDSASRAARRTSLTSARAAVSLSRPISNCRRQDRALARQSISPRRHSSARRLSRSNSDRQSGSPDVGADGPPPSGKGGPDPSSRTGAGIVRKTCAGTDMRTKTTHVEERYQHFAIETAEQNRANLFDKIVTGRPNAYDVLNHLNGLQRSATTLDTSGSTPQPPVLTWFCVRRDGVAKRQGWLGSVREADLPSHVNAHHHDWIDVCIVEGSRPVEARRLADEFYPRARGIVGIEFRLQGKTARYAPMRMLAANLSFPRALDRFLQRHDATLREFRQSGNLRLLSARQFLVSGDGSQIVNLFRGSPVVDPAPAAGENRAEEVAEGIGRWMLRNIDADGRLPYKYWPSRGGESPADNAIRRFLGSLALARLGELRGSARIRDAARRNLRFNLDRYFRDLGDGRGAIVERTGAKLGAASVAALAILESPARAEFARELEKLAAGVESLSDRKHGFRTFFFPPERDGENWNFYSGEALLFWAEAMRRRMSWAPSVTEWMAAFRPL